VTYSVEFSPEAAAELLRIAGVVGSATAIRAADSIRRRLEGDPKATGTSCQKACTTSTRNPFGHFFSLMRNQRLSR